MLLRASVTPRSRSFRFLLTLAGLLALSGAARHASADARAALPATSGTLKMVKSATSPQLFNPGTLENHIDGEAQAVKQYGFKSCTYAEYSPTGGGTQLLTVDIYEMNTPQDAFGYYSHQRSDNAKIVKIGGEGYVEPTAFNFWKGPYYVKMAITASNPAPFQPEMPKLAQAIAAKLSGSTAMPAVMQLLPPGYKPQSNQYQRSDIAGQSYINNGVTGKYPSAGQQAELFVAIYPTPAAAKAAYTKYHTYLSAPGTAAMGQKSADIKGLGESAIGVKTKFSGEVVAALSGKYLIGLRKATTQAAALPIVKAAVAHAK
ncbi:MAG: hypothetical protein JWL77_1958 [Chthonomonadaceae bacterium]|nr:hypothetical protein [Chthonomonadaceae bacterium]